MLAAPYLNEVIAEVYEHSFGSGCVAKIVVIPSPKTGVTKGCAVASCSAAPATLGINRESKYKPSKKTNFLLIFIEYVVASESIVVIVRNREPPLSGTHLGAARSRKRHIDVVNSFVAIARDADNHKL